MTESFTAPCPMCGERTMVKHCNPTYSTCTWAICRNVKCAAVLDMRLRIGHALNSTEKRIRLHYTGGQWTQNMGDVR